MVMAPHRGTQAERIAVDYIELIPVPAYADPAVVAAAMNPALASLVALHSRHIGESRLNLPPFRQGYTWTSPPSTNSSLPVMKLD